MIPLPNERVKACLDYEPSSVTLKGTIKRKVFPGPPNYESVRNGDEPESMWVLHLARTICVNASADWEAEKDVAVVQLVFPEGQKQYAKYRSLLNGKAVAIGTLFHAHTGHHHTRLLLTVTRMKRIR